MRYLSLIAASIFSLLASLSAAFAADSTNNKSGQEGGLEWRQVQEWKIDGQPRAMARSLDGRLVCILNNKDQVLLYSADGKMLGKVRVDPGVDAIDIDPRGEALYLVNKKTGTFTTLAMSFIYNDIDIAGAPSKGPEDAPVTIVIFTDFQCPYCIRLEPMLNEVFEKNKDKVKLVFKNFPLMQMHPMADPAHRAAWAAGQQGKFWEFHDRLFASPKLSDEVIETTAKDLGLDMTRFKADMNSAAAKERIAKDMADGEKAQVTGTPTVFINGHKPPQRTQELYQRMIDEEIGKNRK